MPYPFRDDEASPDAKVIICAVDRIDTPLFSKPIRQGTATQQWPIQGGELNMDVAKFDMPFINFRIFSRS